MATTTQLAVASGLLLTLAACSGWGGGSTPATTQAVTLTFEAQAGQQPVRCGTPMQLLGAGNATAHLRDLRLYVSQVALVNLQGDAVPVVLTPNDWQNSETALIDLEDGTADCAAAGTAATHAQLTGSVPAGHYQGVRFTIGVPPSANHSDYATALPPLDVQAMAWSWQAGRKFAQIEVNPVGGVAGRAGTSGVGKTFMFHLGSGGCTGNPATGELSLCARPNRAQVQLDGFDPVRHKLVMDLAVLYADLHLNEDSGGARGCMSATTDPECGPLFKALQLDLASGKPAGHAPNQSFFRAALK